MISGQIWKLSFFVCVFVEIKSKKMFHEVKECKNCPKDAFLTSSILRVAIFDFSKKVNPSFRQPMVFVKKWPYFHLLLKSNYAQKNVSYDIIERRNAFQDKKNKKFKKSKN